MAEDYAALQTALETEPRYSIDLPGKSLQPLIALLNAEDISTASVFSDVPAAEVINAAGDRLNTLTSDERSRLALLRDQGVVALSQPAIRAELIVIFGITENQLKIALPQSWRWTLFCEAFGFNQVRKEDLWKVLPNIPTSYIAIYNAGLAVRMAAAEALHERHLQELDLETYQDPGVVDNG